MPKSPEQNLTNNNETGKNILQKEEEALMKEMPFKAGPNGGVLLTGIKPEYMIDNYNSTIIDSSEERNRESIEDDPENYSPIDPNYEYCNQKLIWSDPEKLEKEGMILDSMPQILGLKVLMGSKIKDLEADDFKKRLLVNLNFAIPVHYTQMNLSTNKDRDPKVMTEANLSDETSKIWLKYLYLMEALAHPVDLEYLKNEIGKMTEEEQLATLRWTIRCMVIRGGHSRSSGLFSIRNEGGIITTGALLDERFIGFIDKLGRDLVEYLWARDLDYNGVGLDKVAAKEMSEENISSIIKTGTEKVCHKLNIDPKSVLEKARGAKNQKMESNILKAFPELL